MSMKTIENRDLRIKYWDETANPAREGILSTNYSLANGYLGLRGTHEEMPSWASPGFYVAGSYSAAPRKIVPIHPADHILAHPERVKSKYHAEYEKMELSTIPNLPNPVAVRLKVGEEEISLDAASIAACERLMHIDEARVSRRLVIRDSQWRRTIIDSERFVSWANRQLVCFRYVITPDNHAAPLHVEPFINANVTNDEAIQLFEELENHQEPGFNRITVHLPKYKNITISQAYKITAEGKSLALEVAIGVSENAPAEADTVAKESLALGFDSLLKAHRQEVKKSFLRSNVSIDADVYTQQGFNYGLMHLEMAIPYDNPSTSIAVKGLTGEGYKFVILWDVEFHMFPYFLFTNPRQARNLLLYRYNVLDAARENAKKLGYRGAKFPWESGRTGKEECTPWLILSDRELHISADIAYAVKLYHDVTGDNAFLINYGAEIVFETARFFASRVTWNAEKDRYDMLTIGCPDQYHTTADNNPFISRMAKWNLEFAVSLAKNERLAAIRKKINLTDEEAVELQKIAEKLTIIQPDEDGIIEEFDGFFDLSTDLQGTSERFCAHTQAVKQPDVILLFLPFADEYSEEIQRKNWYYYQARTMHGSSLSMAGMALAAARAGLMDESMNNFIRGTRADLDSDRPDTQLGVHLASYAVLWEAVVFGYGGLQPHEDGLHFQPRLPRQWRYLSYGLYWHGCRIDVKLEPHIMKIATDKDNPCDVPVTILDGKKQFLEPGELYKFEMTKAGSG